VNRVIYALTAFMFGLIFAAMLFLCALPKAHGAEPAQTYIGVIVAYQDGDVVAAQAMGHAATQNDCMKGMQIAMAQLTPKPGVTLVALCTPAPPPPAASTVPQQSQHPLPNAKGEDRV